MSARNALGPAGDGTEAMEKANVQALSPRSIRSVDGAPATERVSLFAWRKEVAASDLSSTQRLVCHTLALHMDTSGGSCFPSTPLMAAESGCTKRTIEIALAAIEAAGYVRRERGGANGRGDKSTYEASVPQRAKLVRPSSLETGESASPFGDGKGRSTYTERANLTTEKGEGDSPEEVRRKTGGLPPTPSVDDESLACADARSLPDGWVL